MNNFIFNPIKYEESFFWSLKEILTQGEKVSAPDYTFNTDRLANRLEEMIGEGYSTSVFNADDGFTNENYVKVLNLVIKRFLNHYCFSTDSETFDYNKGYNFIAKMINVLEMTSPRYLKLLEVYEQAKNELLSPVKIETSRLTRFNDTPQDEGDFANDAHTTNLTEDTGTTKNDLDSKMGRIREIESHYNNILLNWSNEFESIFIEEENI